MTDFESAYRAWARAMPRFCEAPATTRARAYAQSVGGWADYGARFAQRFGFAPPTHLRAARAFLLSVDAFTRAALEGLSIEALPALEAPEAAAEGPAWILRVGGARLGVEAGRVGVWIEGAETLYAATALGALYRALDAAPRPADEVGFQRRWAREALGAFEAAP